MQNAKREMQNKENKKAKEKSKVQNEEFKEFCGVWSSSDLNEFKENTREFERIDREDWE